MIKFKKCITVGLFSIMLMPAAANADIITETWTFSVDVVETEAAPYFNAGDIVSFNVTYDDEGTNWNRWTDGINNIAEFGGGDDGLIDTYDATGSTDAAFEFDSKINNYISSLDDTSNWNQAAIDNLIAYSGGMYVADGFYFLFYDDYLYNDDIDYSFGRAFSIPGEELIYSFTPEVSGSFVSRTEMAPVPEPATMLLFGTGLAGLAGYRKRRGMKK